MNNESEVIFENYKKLSAKEYRLKILAEALNNMSVDEVTRVIDDLSKVLRKGSKLNNHINITRGGPGANYDRDFEEIQVAMGELLNKWEDLIWRASHDD